MPLFADLVRILRPEPPPPDAPDPKPPTLAQLRGLLDRLLIDQAGAEAKILSAPTRRDALLLEPGTDRAIRDLDAEVDAAHLLLERLSTAEPELRRRVAAAEATSRAEVWAETRSRLVESLLVGAAAHRAQEAAMAEFHTLRAEAQRLGFRDETAPLPYPVSPVNSVSLTMFADAIRKQQLQVPLQSALYTVQFRAFTVVGAGTPGMVGYLTHQQAGFDAATAWGLVEGGSAEWADKKNIPPKPRKPRRRKKGEPPEPVPPEVARVFGAGIADSIAENLTGRRGDVRAPWHQPDQEAGHDA